MTQETAAPEHTSTWITLSVRPAGRLDRAGTRRLSHTLKGLCADADMVVLDLSAVDVEDPVGLTAVLATADRVVARREGCLLVTGAPLGVRRDLDAAGVGLTTLG